MSKQANPTKIGLFIVIGVGLCALGLMLFGSARLFTQSHQLILYFNDSLNGLNDGAPVKYRGVTVGSVKRVMIHYNQATNDYAMPVLIEVRKDLLQQNLPDGPDVFSDQELDVHVQGGLRAVLQAESLVTGVLYVEISPGAGASPPVYHQLKKIYQELPTEPTDIKQLLNNLASLDIKGVFEHLNELITRLDTTVTSFKTEEISRDVTNLLTSVNEVVRSPLLTNSLANLGTTLEQYRLLGEKLNQRVDPLADSVTNTLAEATRTLAQLRGGTENLRALLSPDSPLQNNLNQALQQLADAAQSISALAEFLKQHPNALITGRQSPTQKP